MPDFFAEGNTPRRLDTRWRILQKILGALVGSGSPSSGGGTGGSSGEILAYTTTGPTADGIFPSSLNHEAIAVKPGAATFTWNSTTHVWDDV